MGMMVHKDGNSLPFRALAVTQWPVGRQWKIGRMKWGRIYTTVRRNWTQTHRIHENSEKHSYNTSWKCPKLEKIPFK